MRNHVYVRNEDSESSDSSSSGWRSRVSAGKEEKKKSGGRIKVRNGTVLKTKDHKYKVMQLLGSGGFGDVYKVIQQGTELECAMKNEMNDLPHDELRRLPVELQILLDCTMAQDEAKKKHFLALIGYGKTPQFKFVVMSLVSLSIEDVRKRVLRDNFCKSTAMQCCIQTFESVADLHEVGYIHRDIKPGNFAIGLGDKESVVYILDFGIGRKYMEKDGKSHRPERKYCKFMGTIRYASRSCHASMDQSRRDDLEVWMYICIDFFDEHGLPWRRMINRKQVYETKKQFFELKCAAVWKFLPAGFKVLVQYIDKLKFAETPDYAFMKTELNDIAKQDSIDLTVPLDWVGKVTADALLDISRTKEEELGSKFEDEEKDKEEEKDKLEPVDDIEDPFKRLPFNQPSTNNVHANNTGGSSSTGGTNTVQMSVMTDVKAPPMREKKTNGLSKYFLPRMKATKSKKRKSPGSPNIGKGPI